MELKTNKRKMYIYLVMSLGFVILGICLVILGTKTIHTIGGWLNIVFFSFGSIVFIRMIADKMPRIIIGENGLTDSELGLGEISWSDINSASVESIFGTRFISLQVMDESKYLNRLGRFKQSIMRMNRVIGFNQINLNMSNVDADAEEICRLILERSSDHREKFH